jgi:D-alanyl-D-alanine carboxypeptidase (penicillin-binding protein 5/6)
MDLRKTLAVGLMALAILILISIPLWLFTPVGSIFGSAQANLNGPPLTPLPFKVIPRPKPQPVLLAQGTPDQFSANYAMLMDANTGTILYDKNGEMPVPMASTTKIMTALIAIQSGKLTQMVTIGQDAFNEVHLNGGSGANLVVGDQIPLQDLLYGLMLPSGDDAAVAIADAVGGSVPNFVTIMNVEAQRLHLYQTHYANPDGLEVTDSQGNPISGVHYTTAYDLARLTSYAMSVPLFAQIVQTKEMQLPATAVRHAYVWTNINFLLFNYRGTIGVKTGWTPQAGGCLVFAARRNGQTLIGVVLDSANETTRFTDAETLLDWGFKLPVQLPQA